MLVRPQLELLPASNRRYLPSESGPAVVHRRTKLHTLLAEAQQTQAHRLLRAVYAEAGRAEWVKESKQQEPTPAAVRFATEADREAFIEVASDAFSSSDLFAHLIDSTNKAPWIRRLCFKILLSLAFVDAMNRGFVLMTADGNAAIVCTDGKKPGIGDILKELPSFVAFALLSGPAAASRLLNYSDCPQPVPENGWQLQILCVKPEFQSKGYGRALLQAALDELVVQRGYPVVLDTDTSLLVRYYGKLGFKVEAMQSFEKLCQGAAWDEATVSGWPEKPIEELEGIPLAFMVLQPEDYPGSK